MSSVDGRDGRGATPNHGKITRQGLETMLFESLVHHLIEKGLLTRNDALSVVQTVAEVKRAQLMDQGSDDFETDAELAALRRLFDSFAAMREGPRTGHSDGHNVHELRPPLHGENPSFPDND